MPLIGFHLSQEFLFFSFLRKDPLILFTNRRLNNAAISDYSKAANLKSYRLMVDCTYAACA